MMPKVEVGPSSYLSFFVFVLIDTVVGRYITSLVDFGMKVTIFCVWRKTTAKNEIASRQDQRTENKREERSILLSPQIDHSRRSNMGKKIPPSVQRTSPETIAIACDIEDDTRWRK
jgi:hypothetical protein